MDYVNSRKTTNAFQFVRVVGVPRNFIANAVSAGMTILSSGVGIYNQPAKLLNPSDHISVNVPAPSADASVPAVAAAPAVPPAIPEATAPGVNDAGVVEVYVPNAEALVPTRIPSCWEVEVPDWETPARSISMLDALLLNEDAVWIMTSVSSATTVWSSIETT